MIELNGLTKQYGQVRAVDNLSFTVKPGVVTGFLGPNGAGKSTTMRMIVGLDNPTAGTALIDGRHYRELDNPIQKVGVLLDAKAVHPNRSAYNSLLWQAQAAGLPSSRVDEVLDLVGLTSVAKKRAGGFSLGMGQRLGIASAMLGNPEVLILDEPVNGLDPEGIRWVRDLLKSFASEGRTVLVSSHLLSEMAMTADELVVIGRGQLVASGSINEFIKQNSQVSTVVRSPHLEEFGQALKSEGVKFSVERDQDGRQTIVVPDTESDRIGEIAFSTGVMLTQLSEQRASLEEAYLRKTEGAVQYHTGLPGGPAGAPQGMPPQGMPPQGIPPQGMPPQGFAGGPPPQPAAPGHQAPPAGFQAPQNFNNAGEGRNA